MLSVKYKGNFNKAERFFNRMLRRDYLNVLAKYGELGVRMLAQATPVDTGKTANSWNYEIEENRNGHVVLAFTNSNTNQGVNIVLLLMYGHGTKEGAYIEGEDFVNPAIRPVFQDMIRNLWKEVTR